jgi:hypothetical protein
MLRSILIFGSTPAGGKRSVYIFVPAVHLRAQRPVLPE